MDWIGLLGRVLLVLAMRVMSSWLANKERFSQMDRGVVIDELTAAAVNLFNQQKAIPLPLRAFFGSPDRIRPLVENAMNWASSGLGEILVRTLDDLMLYDPEVTMVSSPDTATRLQVLSAELLRENAGEKEFKAFDARG